MTSPLTGEAVQSLREQVRGQVITAADEGYDGARMVHNGMFDRRPLAVMEAEQVGDVIGAVNFAREHGLDLSVRGGGHSGPGFGTNEAGLVIDMSRMRTVHVDPRTKTARADAGATWGDFNYATHAFGLATTGGIISTTGIAGPHARANERARRCGPGSRAGRASPWRSGGPIRRTPPVSRNAPASQVVSRSSMTGKSCSSGGSQGLSR